jgi:hypothetical protein
LWRIILDIAWCRFRNASASVPNLLLSILHFARQRFPICSAPFQWFHTVSILLLIHYFVLAHSPTDAFGWWQTILTSQTVAYRRFDAFLLAIAHSRLLLFVTLNDWFVGVAVVLAAIPAHDVIVIVIMPAVWAVLPPVNIKPTARCSLRQHIAAVGIVRVTREPVFIDEMLTAAIAYDDNGFYFLLHNRYIICYAPTGNMNGIIVRVVTFFLPLRKWRIYTVSAFLQSQ